MGRLALTVSYDGTDFAGSQVQPGVRTVQGELDRALADLFGQPTPTVLAGRTDRGVHAAGQVVGCRDGRPDLAPSVLQRALNARLEGDLAIVAVERRDDRFHARYDAAWREYRYRLWSGERAPLVRRYAWQRRGALDVALMAETAGRLVGRHDFASFAGGGEGVPWSDRRARPQGTVRTVLACSVAPLRPWWTGETSADGHLVEVRVVADGFLPQMVRNLTGALVAVGAGDRPPAWLDRLLAARDRRVGGATAPAHGLTLWRVGYGPFDPRPGGPTSADKGHEPERAFPPVERHTSERDKE
jgi:tRNA pseudouridine38-40 synthase